MIVSQHTKCEQATDFQRMCEVTQQPTILQSVKIWLTMRRVCINFCVEMISLPH